MKKLIHLLLGSIVIIACSKNDDSIKVEKSLSSVEMLLNNGQRISASYHYNNDMQWIGGSNSNNEDYTLSYQNGKLYSFEFNSIPDCKTIYSRDSNGNISEIVESISGDRYKLNYINNRLSSIAIVSQNNTPINTTSFTYNSKGQISMAITEESHGIDGRRFDYMYDTKGRLNEAWEYYRNSNTDPWSLAFKKRYTYISKSNPFYKLYQESCSQDELMISRVFFQDEYALYFENFSSVNLFMMAEDLLSTVKIYEGTQDTSLIIDNNYEYVYDADGYPTQAVKTSYHPQSNITLKETYTYYYEE